jgi:Pyridoxamine 5'-phosphate oxidase
MPATDAADLTARAIIDTSLYLVLATADGTGRPWSSPVYFAPDGYAEFFWVSAAEATHSRNIAARPQIGIVIFDSHAPIGTGQGVYISAVAEQVGGDDLTRGVETFSRIHSHTAAPGGRSRTCRPRVACGCTGPWPTRTQSSPRTAALTIASPRTPPDRRDIDHGEPPAEPTTRAGTRRPSVLRSSLQQPMIPIGSTRRTLTMHSAVAHPRNSRDRFATRRAGLSGVGGPPLRALRPHAGGQ